jgi:drug/metabolite transporter (DMT)-like permease
LEPLATVGLAVPLLGEPFGPFIAAGGAMVLVGVWVGGRARA